MYMAFDSDIAINWFIGFIANNFARIVFNEPFIKIANYLTKNIWLHSRCEH